MGHGTRNTHTHEGNRPLALDDLTPESATGEGTMASMQHGGTVAVNSRRACGMLRWAQRRRSDWEKDGEEVWKEVYGIRQMGGQRARNQGGEAKQIMAV